MQPCQLIVAILDLKVDNHGHERNVVILTDTQPPVLFDFHM
jgi:hypothetical protein